jgi:CHASE3 domain sensor protein
MSQSEYTKRLGKIIAKLQQLIVQGRKIKRPERVNVNMSEWTLARLQLLAAYRGVTLSTAADEAIKRAWDTSKRISSQIEKAKPSFQPTRAWPYRTR